MRRIGLTVAGCAASIVMLAALAPAGIARASASSGEATRKGHAARFDPLVEEFFQRWFGFHPQEATRLGIHRWDDRLTPITEASVEAEAAWLREVRARLRAIPASTLSFDRRLDRITLEAWVERQLFDLEVVRPYERNPNLYVGLITSSIQSLLERDFASECLRAQAASRRLGMVPEVLRAAKINLRHPPLLFTEVAIEQARGALRFYRETVPAFASRCHDPSVQADLVEADSTAVRATEDYVRFLDEDLRPRSDGNVALGKDVYQRKLHVDEMEDAPVDSLLSRGWRALDQTRARMREIAAAIAPGSDLRAVLDSIGAEHPSALDQLAFVAAQLDSVRAFLRHRDLFTRPAHEHLMVRETPPFARSLSFASLDPPGVWENSADEAYLNVTPADPRWSESQRQDHLAFFNRWNTRVVVVHEALPGHYLQFLALRRVHSRIRAALGSRSNIEGWAHYCEQMAVEEGLGEGDPRIELAQQWLALQRLGRLIVGLSIHTAGMTAAEAAAFFEQQCWMTPITAQREARRGALDPTYVVYTLGKWHILALRNEVRAALGNRYTPRAFHDALLAQGIAPLPVVRAGVLHALTGRSVVLGEP